MPLTPAMRPLAIHRREAERPMSAPPTMAEYGVNPTMVRILLSQIRHRRNRVRRVPSGPAARADRKSVVEGQSVSVRVGLGGRRIVKNKNSMYITYDATLIHQINKQAQNHSTTYNQKI